MKKIITLLPCFIFAISTFAQECTNYYPMQKGVKMELTSYDKKDKTTGKINYEVIEASSNSAKIHSVFQDKKGEEIHNSTFEIKCENNTFYVDMSNVIPKEQFESFKSMDMDIETSFIEFPAKLSVGQKLPDGTITMTIKSNGTTIMTMTVNVINRTVEAKEEITTPAGTFMCYIISEDVLTDMGMAKVNASSKNWISENVGAVKSESYDKKGNLTGKTVLTAFSK